MVSTRKKLGIFTCWNYNSSQHSCWSSALHLHPTLQKKYKKKLQHQTWQHRKTLSDSTALHLPADWYTCTWHACQWQNIWLPYFQGETRKIIPWINSWEQKRFSDSTDRPVCRTCPAEGWTLANERIKTCNKVVTKASVQQCSLHYAGESSLLIIRNLSNTIAIPLLFSTQTQSSWQ